MDAPFHAPMRDVPFSDPVSHEAAVSTLLLVRQIFSSMGVFFWLSHGTLLGVIRDRDFIVHDSDIDLGIWDEGTDHNTIRQALLAAGFSFVLEFGSHGHGHQYAFWSPFGTYLDLFFYQQFGNSTYATIWAGPSEPRRQRFPLIDKFVPREFCGEPFSIPANFEDILLSNYGLDWRTPVPPVERGGQWHWANSPLNYEKDGAE
jgi:hypothetical protein